MKFALSDEQRQFAASLRDLLGEADVPSISRRWADGDLAPGLDLVRRLGSVGVTGIVIPERWEGVGAEPIDLVVTFVELGRYAVPGPLIESIAVVPSLLAELDAEQVTGKWLLELAEGRCLAAFQNPPLVPYAVDADAAGIVLSAHDDTISSGQASGPRLSSVDPARRLFDVLTDTLLAQDETVPGIVARASEFGALACAAELLGAGRALLDTTCEYARQRVQFGKPIGQFQAVKHHLASVLVGLELAEPLLFGAALSLDPRDISAAKVACADAAYRAARTALQVHGAVGYTLEHDLGLWITRVRALVSAWGTPSWHRARVATALAEGVACPSR